MQETEDLRNLLYLLLLLNKKKKIRFVVSFGLLQKFDQKQQYTPVFLVYCLIKTFHNVIAIQKIAQPIVLLH